jgi:signal transduction histidine kinase
MLLECLDFIETSVFVLDVDENGEPIYTGFNLHAQTKSGISLDDVIGKTAKEIFSGRGGQAAYARHKEVIKTGRAQEYEIRLPFRYDVHLLRTTLKPVKDAAGNVIRLIGTSTDHTQEEIGREVQASVTKITHEMEDFITMAAHDLRTPMRNVHHIADMLRDDFQDLGDGKIDLINLLEDVAIKATSLISDVLAHAQATKSSKETVTFDFVELCRELCGILDPLGTHKISFAGGHITGDKTAYQIVIRNLLDNAFKHGGRDQLILSIKVSAANDDMIEVSVRDDGQGFENPGIAFLGNGKLRTDSGFGLLGIRRLVQSRGGNISAETPNVGQGSLIKFTLPGSLVAQHDLGKPQITVAS